MTKKCVFAVLLMQLSYSIAMQIPEEDLKDIRAQIKERELKRGLAQKSKEKCSAKKDGRRNDVDDQIAQVIKLPRQEILVDRLNKLLGEQNFVTQSKLAEKLGGQKKEPMVAAKIVSNALFDYTQMHTKQMNEQQKQAWVEKISSCEKDIYQAIFQEYPKILAALYDKEIAGIISLKDALAYQELFKDHPDILQALRVED